MAAKRARAEKTVLSRQDIAERRRAIKEKKGTTEWAGKRALVGVVVLAGSLLALVSLTSFHPQARPSAPVQNAAGPVGHAMADGLRGLLGICAYALPMAGLYLAGVLFVGSKDKRRWPQMVAAVMLLVSICVLAQILGGAPARGAYPLGGSLGAELSEVLCGMFSVVGTTILVSALCLAALIVGVQAPFLRICRLCWDGVRAGGVQLVEASKVFLANQKVALAARREAAAKAKVEEAAFLAQLEADEEELEAAEREIAEAEQMAEEAHRLAKEAEAREAAEAAAKQEKKLRGKKAAEATVAVAPPPTAPATLAPGADPAWASSLSLQSPVAAPATASADTLVGESSTKKRKAPNLVLPAGPSAAPSVPPPSSAAAVPPLPVAGQTAGLATLPAPAAVAAMVPVAATLARTPLIVEPKAPPKPVAKKQPEQFQFMDGRTSFTLPPLDVLEEDRSERSALDKDAFLSTAEKLRAKLADFGIIGEVVEIRPGPVVTMYEFLPGPGIKVSKIASLADDLAMAMEAMRVRIVAPIPGKGVVGIEVPNRDRETVFLRDIVEQDVFQKSASKVTMSLGKDIEGMPYVLDLQKAPHLLIAGTTGSGKSVAVNSMIMSILLKATPEEVRFIMVDPKMLELSVYEGIPHLLLPVVTDPKKAALALRWAVEEMERRYHLLSDAGVRNIAGYNKLVETSGGDPQVMSGKESTRKTEKPKNLLVVDVAAGESEDAALERAKATESFGVAAPRDEAEEPREAMTPPAEEIIDGDANASIDEIAAQVQAENATVADKKELKKLPYIVVIIDELADLMMVASREVETYIARLAQMARAAGIHLMVATQRPSTDVVTGVIKANFPTRISFMLRSKPDSMTILGTIGAEALLGMGDMLIMPPTSAHMVRVHGAYVSEQEIKRAVDHLKAQGKPVYDDSILKPRDEESEGGGAPEDELSDELYDQALATVSDMRQVSISMLQRKMRIGYNRAARMIERMERDGVVGPADGAKPREVLLRPVGEMPGAEAM